MHSKLTLSLLIVLLITSFSVSAQDKLPSVMLEKDNGSKINILDAVKEKDLSIIDFWATWCIPCRHELENISDLYADWQAEWNMQLIAVSIDDAKTKSQVMPYINGRGYDYKVLLDPNSEFFLAVNGLTPPLTLIVDKNGQILFIHHGYIEGDEYELEDFMQNWFKKNG